MAGDHAFTWLVTVLASTLSSPGFLCCLARSLGLPARLLWPSLRPRVCESSVLSAWSFPFRGPTPISRLFLNWRPCRSRSLIPSLTPSWWCPCPLMRWALLTLSGYVLSVPSAFSLRRSRWLIPSHCRPSRAVSLLTVSVICER